MDKPLAQTSDPGTGGVPSHDNSKAGFPERKPAFFFNRFAAYMLDNLFIAGVVVLIAGAGVKFIGITLDDINLEELGSLLSMVWVFQAVASLGYFTIMIGSGGQTFGKSILNIEVIRSDGSKVDYGRAFIRAIGYYISSYILYLGFLLALVDSEKQALHDKLADTVVVEID